MTSDISRGFGSDNHAGVHPQIMQALVDANAGHAPSYGTDANSRACDEEFRRVFGPDTRVFYVFNGTAANVLSLRAVTKSYHSVICSAVAHLNVDECAAPEVMGGRKLIALEAPDGKLTVKAIEECLVRGGDQHFAQPGLVSITQPTELGTVYSLDEMQEIAEFAHSHGMLLHIDGARLMNAAASLGVEPGDLVAGADIVSLGGTKNGFLYGEAVLLMNSEFVDDMRYIRKQSCQLPSKTRFVAAQFDRYLRDGLWREIAQHSNAQANKLRCGLEDIEGIHITQATQANAVFAIMPRAWFKPLRSAGFFYVWNEKTDEVRLMTSFDTTDSDIEQFVAKANALAQA